MIDDPRFAPRRDDLSFLRRRRRPRAAPVAPEPTPKISFDRPDRHHTGTAPAISFERPGRPHGPTPAAPAAPAAPPPAPVPAPQPPPAPPASSSLDLDEPAPPAPQPATTPPQAGPIAPPAREPQRRARQDVRVAAGRRAILTVAEPTVTLTRLQSAIGTIAVEAAVSAAVGDLRLGCGYELSSGYSSTVQLTDGNRFAPPRSRRPVIVASHEHFERLALDLRQCTDLRRLCVYAFSASRQPLRWSGTLIVTTFGGAKVELPLDPLQGGNVATLLSLYNVRGEFVLRAEMQSFNGGVRDAVRAYGYDRITWLDDRTPVE